MADEQSTALEDAVEDGEEKIEQTSVGPQEFYLGSFSRMPSGEQFIIKGILVNGVPVQGSGTNVLRVKDVITVLSGNGNLGKLFSRVGFLVNGAILPDNLIAPASTNLDIEFGVPEQLLEQIEAGQTLRVYVSGRYGSGVVSMPLVFLGDSQNEKNEKKKGALERKQRYAEDFNKEETSDFGGLMANALHKAPLDALSMATGGVFNPLLSSRMQSALVNNDAKTLKNLTEVAIKNGDKKTLEAVLQSASTAEQKEILSSALVKIEKSQATEVTQRRAVSVNTESGLKTKASVKARMEAEDLEAQASLMDEEEINSTVSVSSSLDGNISSPATTNIGAEVKTEAANEEVLQSSVSGQAEAGVSGQVSSQSGGTISENASQSLNSETSVQNKVDAKTTSAQKNIETATLEDSQTLNTDSEEGNEAKVEGGLEQNKNLEDGKENNSPVSFNQNANLELSSEMGEANKEDIKANVQAGVNAKGEFSEPKKDLPGQEKNKNGLNEPAGETSGSPEEETQARPQESENNKGQNEEPDESASLAGADKAPGTGEEKVQGQTSKAGQEIFSRLKNREKRSLMQSDLDRAESLAQNEPVRGEKKGKAKNEPSSKGLKNPSLPKLSSAALSGALAGAVEPGLDSASESLGSTKANVPSKESGGEEAEDAPTLDTPPEPAQSAPVSQNKVGNKQKEEAGELGEDELPEQAEENLPPEPVLPQVPQEKEVTAEIKVAAETASKFLDTMLLSACAWIWGMAIPTFGLSIILGAVAGDFIVLLKGWLISRATRGISLPEKVKDYTDKIAEQVTISMKVKLNILLMNLIALIMIVAFFLFFLYVGCNTPVGIASHRFSYIGSSYPQACEVMDSMKIGEITKTGVGQGQVKGAAEYIQTGINAR
ncbi:MAG: hypothetical protein JNN11_04575 [Candidatus Doudnabacteria bacterium]|nr:hypothetical protein [Candidatus Doudnabacteria bacterium]